MKRHEILKMIKEKIPDVEYQFEFKEEEVHNGFYTEIRLWRKSHETPEKVRISSPINKM